MRLLLVQLPTSHLGSRELVYPIGLARLAVLVPPDSQKWTFDMNLEPDPWPRLKAVLLQSRPEAVGFSFRNLDPLAGSHTSYLSSLKTAIALTRAFAPTAKIICGGPAFSLFGERLMRELPEIDMGVIGEGERAFISLLSRDFDPGSAPGLLWRAGASIRKNPRGAYTSLDELPAPDLQSFPLCGYTGKNSYVAAIGVEGKRGCDLRCGYCVYPLIGGGKARMRAPRAIVNDMEWLHKESGIELFHFTDSVVNRPPEHLREVCEEIARRKLNVGWTGFFREDSLTDELAEHCARAGAVAFYFSGDALTDYGLELLNKKMTKAHLLRASEVSARSGILTMLHFLINLPHEREEHFQEARDTLDRVLSIHDRARNLGAVIFNNVRVYPGAPLTRKILKMGLLDPRQDLLYPTYFNPPRFAHALHEFQAYCEEAGVMARLGGEGEQ